MAADEEDWELFSWSTLTMLIIVVIVIASIYFGYGFLSNTQEPFGSSDDVADIGDTVEVDYTGTYEDGSIFDTTYEEVANNNYLYPKAGSFEEKGNYQPFKFVMGSMGVSIQDVQMPAFADAIEGMTVGQTETITLDSEDGFGVRDDSLVKNINLTESFPIFTTNLNVSDFEQRYQVSPSIGLNVPDSEYGWNVSVYFIDTSTDEVTLKHEPYIGEIIDYNGVWTSEVISVDASVNPGHGEILIRHIITENDVSSLYGEDIEGNFVVTGLDTGAGTATLDYNHEGVGKNLIFTITLVSAEAPE